MQALRRKFIILMMGLNVLVGAFSSVSANETIFTQEEREYIQNRAPIDTMAFHGGAPIQYVNDQGKIQGIAVDVLNSIAEISGLQFNINAYGTLEEALQNKPELYLGLSSNYSHDAFYMSDAFLKSETPPFINNFMEFDEFKDLRGKRYVQVKDSQKVEDLITFQQASFATRLETIESVQKNKNDFGIGNDYSIAYYLASGIYNNVVRVPIKGATRSYHFGLLHDDLILMEILIKSIKEISDTQLQKIILSAITEGRHEGRFITFFNRYNQLIFMVVFLALFAFVYISIKLMRARSRLHFANQKYELLSEFSGELLFEYDLQEKSMNFLGKESCHHNKIYAQKYTQDEIINAVTEVLENKEHIIELRNLENDLFYVRIKQFIIRDRHDHEAYVFGSLLDVTDETKALEILEFQSRIDGLTNLYNARYTKEKIKKHLEEKESSSVDAMILIDLDDFKQVNDSYGHLKGDSVLRNVAMILNVIFENAHIIGRYGGDEFIVYLKDVSSCGYVRDLCYQLIQNFRNTMIKMTVTPSIGVSMVTSQTTFEDLFEEVDRAMYTSKKNGKNHVVIYQENLNRRGDHDEK